MTDFGPAGITNTIFAVDADEPAAPQPSGEQTAINAGVIHVPAPEKDANGNDLSGLTQGECIVLPMTADDAIAAGYVTNPEAAKLHPNAQVIPFEISQGQTVDVPFQVNVLNSAVYCGIVRLSDDPIPTPT